MKTIFALIAMTRIGNSMMAGIGIIVGYLFSGNRSPHSLTLLIIAGTVSLGFGNVINDIYDIDTDRIAHPTRPLPSGRVTKATAIAFAILLVLIALFAGFTVSTAHGVATFVPLILLFIYAYRLKGTPLVGNLLVSLLVAYTMIYGAIGGRIELAFIPALLACITNMIREIVKDCADKEGDEAAGLVTTAHLELVIIDRLVYSLMILAGITAPLPIVFEEFRILYLWVIILFVVPFQVLAWKQYRRRNYSIVAKLVKLQLLGGLIGFACEGVRYYW